ncbi:DNA-binding protein MK1619 [Colletotrichum liriopes]|uniref:DNA-binding protein MK1619 n=1 Tax=Colletotrichum liriopes TaxID=708192 RepID=A0AA37GYF2_9PEZI|nr:DNA-binding protein MK1619 [Colletotrichum liriopes]
MWMNEGGRRGGSPVPIEKLCVHLLWLGQSIVEDADITRPTPHILNKILHPEAADLLGRIRLAMKQSAQDVENRLIVLAQSGQLRSKVTEAQLKELLAAVADNKEEEKIVVRRHKERDNNDDGLLDFMRGLNRTEHFR